MWVDVWKDSESLPYFSELMADNPQTGGDREEHTPPIAGVMLSTDGKESLIRLLAKPGKYCIIRSQKPHNHGQRAHPGKITGSRSLSVGQNLEGLSWGFARPFSHW